MSNKKKSVTLYVLVFKYILTKPWLKNNNQ